MVGTRIAPLIWRHEPTRERSESALTLRDPVCGMKVKAEGPIRSEVRGVTFGSGERPSNVVGWAVPERNIGRRWGRSGEKPRIPPLTRAAGCG